ncbi:hypothetical protein J6590_035470 [Homalodisca vitripennis]|nr:hypothetical protein J6590_035470 [Homalodisca vitripennis]
MVGSATPYCLISGRLGLFGCDKTKSPVYGENIDGDEAFCSIAGVNSSTGDHRERNEVREKVTVVHVWLILANSG